MQPKKADKTGGGISAEEGGDPPDMDRDYKIQRQALLEENFLMTSHVLLSFCLLVGLSVGMS